MGALHRLVDLLQKLDPNNESWKRDRLAEAWRYRDARRIRREQEESFHAPVMPASPTSKNPLIPASTPWTSCPQAYLVENCIYGVDIQPIATQIVKLRFFISGG